MMGASTVGRPRDGAIDFYLGSVYTRRLSRLPMGCRTRSTLDRCARIRVRAPAPGVPDGGDVTGVYGRLDDVCHISLHGGRFRLCMRSATVAFRSCRMLGTPCMRSPSNDPVF